ncbi:uncharacterized protein LOC116254540 [Nymphaea colorata]|nr:uncharacterized protein LOC116254540 [Nymphaea colorata]
MEETMERSPKGRATPKFSVYENPVLSAALTARSVRPSTTTLLLFLFALLAAASAIISLASREEMFVEYLKSIHVSQSTAGFFTKVTKIVLLFILLGAVSAFIQAFSLQRSRNVGLSSPLHSSQVTKGHGELTKHQQELLGLKTKSATKVDSDFLDHISAHQKSKATQPPTTSPANVLVPVHTPVTNLTYSSRVVTGKRSDGKTVSHTPSGRLPSASLSPNLVTASRSQGSSHGTRSLDRPYTTPRLKQRSAFSKEISSEEMLENFLADLDEKFLESATKSTTPSQSLMTPPPTLHGVGVAGHSPITSSVSGTTRSTPLRPVRASPSSQKYSTTPKKGEGDLPPPMTLEQSIEAFGHLGVYPHIEQWRDRLRQWFSAVLLKPLLEKIEASHVQVMQTAAKVGISISINQVGSALPYEAASSNAPPVDGANEWQSTYMLDEDGILHQLRATLLQARDGSASHFSIIGLQHPQQSPFLPVIQECVDAITEHQRLHALLKGELVKGLLPQSSVRADYTVQRIRELAEGTCLKNYEYLGSGEVYDKVNKKWTLELPIDSHLLLYLFCAFMEHPKWMLHVDPTSYASIQSSKNPLYLGVLPPKERLPEKYVAVLSSVPSVIHPGACILVVGKQSPPVFALYWDKKLQFSIQGRTALWDAILLLCHRIKVGYGSVVRGVHLGSSALNILPILDLEADD